MEQCPEYLLSGSFAYDTIRRHDGLFQTHILPEAVGRLNVAFDVASSRTEFGGTAGNISYNSALLKQNPLLVGCLGHDFEQYVHHLERQGLNPQSLQIVNELPTANCTILTDAADNQITAFDRGAMKSDRALPYAPVTPNVWHLAPENPLTTAKLALSALRNGREYFFDPGQVLPAFLNGEADSVMALEDLLGQATGIFVNDYEAELLCAKTGKPLSHWLTEDGQFIIRTRGSEGLELSISGYRETLSVAQANRIVDPTGCGDALRAGFLFGYTNNWGLRDCAMLGAVMGSFAIEQGGGQVHRPTTRDIATRLSDLARVTAAPGTIRESLFLEYSQFFSAERRNAWLAEVIGKACI